MTLPDPKRFAGLDRGAQQDVVLRIVREDPDLTALLVRLRESRLRDAWLTSGAVYGTVWNVLTGKPRRHGIKDYDIIYFDDRDLSWEAEDREIRRIVGAMAHLGLPVEVRNQARVHLWYPDRFGTEYPRLFRSVESLEYYASQTHAVAVRDTERGFDIHAPFGLEALFALRMVPNRVLPNCATHTEKSARAQRNWPEVSVEPW